MKFLLLSVLLVPAFSAVSQSGAIGIFTNQSDIGNPKNAGSAVFNKADQSYTLKGSGYNIWFNRDEFHYLYNQVKGDFICTASFEFVGDSGNAHRKIGWMIRESADAEAAHISAVNHGNGLTVLQWRKLRGAYMRDPQDEIFFPKKNAQIIQLERKGKLISMRVAHFGEPLQLVGSQEMDELPDSVLVGLFISAHDSGAVEQARVWNVRIDRPVEEDYNADRQGYLGCRLEIMDVANGMRKIVRESSGRFEAPNWMPDGKRLLYNEGGSIYTIPIEGGVPEKLNTGSANRNNNDHGISFDGKKLAISNHLPDLPGGGSTIFILPLEGGVPKQITQKTPSYWHGWNPNGREVSFVGMRDGKVYNLYKISVDGGEEIALTHNTTGHVDGPEYSPDGKYIYYNANPTGTMQIWRMKPDGSSPEQITFDQYNNWFPHISPDGKWILFISFPYDIMPDAHPSYKRVMLRIMPAAGGAPRALAYLYGGQGTINVPSWSPDSRHVAFVSNSGR